MTLTKTKTVGYVVLGSDEASGREYGVLEAREVDDALIRIVYHEVFTALYTETGTLHEGVVYKRLSSHPHRPVILGATRVTRSARGREGLQLKCLVLDDAHLERVGWNPFHLSEDCWRTILGSEARASMRPSLSRTRESTAAMHALASSRAVLLARPRQPLAIIARSFDDLDGHERRDVLPFCTAWPDARQEPPHDFGLCYTAMESRMAVNPVTSWQQRQTSRPTVTPDDNPMAVLIWENRTLTAYEHALELAERAERGQKLDVRDCDRLEDLLDVMDRGTRWLEKQPSTRLSLSEMRRFASSCRASLDGPMREARTLARWRERLAITLLVIGALVVGWLATIVVPPPWAGTTRSLPTHPEAVYTKRGGSL